MHVAPRRTKKTSSLMRVRGKHGEAMTPLIDPQDQRLHSDTSRSFRKGFFAALPRSARRPLAYQGGWVTPVPRIRIPRRDQRCHQYATAAISLFRGEVHVLERGGKLRRTEDEGKRRGCKHLKSAIGCIFLNRHFSLFVLAIFSPSTLKINLPYVRSWDEKVRKCESLRKFTHG